MLVEQAPYGFFEIDIEGFFTFLNEAFCRIFDGTREELENHKFTEFMTPDHGQEALSCLTQVDVANKPVKISWRIIHRNGHHHILEVFFLPIIYTSGQIKGYHGMALEAPKKILPKAAITKSRKRIKQLYAASLETEQRYQAFLEFLPIPLLVQNLDHSVAYLNPAFEKTFGWNRADLEANPLAYIPDDQVKTTKTGKLRLLQDGALSGIATQRLTKDGRVLDVINDGSLFYDLSNNPAGIVVALRDVTKSRKTDEIFQTLFSITKALHHYSDLNGLLTFISHQIQALLNVQHAHIILVDEENNECYFRAGVVKDAGSYHPFSKARIPLDSSYFSGRVILTGKPYIIHDLTKEEIKLVYSKQGVKSILGVPIELGDRIIGALVVINKIDTAFSEDDSDLLSSIASIISLPIENTRINDELRSSYEEIKSLNKAKDRIIEHLSHELRTPLAVLSASLGLLAGDECSNPETVDRILIRCQRNLKRITNMQSEIVDITRNPNHRIQQTLKTLLELCTDELESLADVELGPDAGQTIRRRIEEYFKPRSLELKQIEIGPFVSTQIEKLAPLFEHRKIEVLEEIEENVGFINLPDDVLDKIFTGLVRNAVEYTPDGGKITIAAKKGTSGPELTVTDTGTGITEENQHLIFGNYFTTADISQYGTGNPYDFNAGGSSFDLLRMQVFSEQFNFKIILQSYRCPHIPEDSDICPGSIEHCDYCDSPVDCYRSGGTSFTIQFNKKYESAGIINNL